MPRFSLTVNSTHGAINLFRPISESTVEQTVLFLKQRGILRRFFQLFNAFWDSLMKVKGLVTSLREKLGTRQRRAAFVSFPDNLQDQWEQNGFVVLSGLFGKSKTRQLRTLLDEMWDSRQHSTNPLVVDTCLETGGVRKFFRDAEESERSTVYKLNDAFIEQRVVRDFALDPTLSAAMELLCGGKVCICNSLQFERGSQQPLHVDTFYMPPPAGGELIVTSICLEDVHPEAGPLTYVAGSHLIPPFLNEFGTTTVTGPEQHNRAKSYYDAQISDRRLVPETFLGKEGDVIIWHEQLLHGGSPISDFSRTRRSLVTHYWRAAELKPDQMLQHGAGYYLNRGHQMVGS